MLEHLDAGHAGHAQIENGGVEGALLQRLDRGLPSGQTVTSWPSRGSSERMNSCSDVFVVGEQDPQALVRCRPYVKSVPTLLRFASRRSIMDPFACYRIRRSDHRPLSFEPELIADTLKPS